MVQTSFGWEDVPDVAIGDAPPIRTHIPGIAPGVRDGDPQTSREAAAANPLGRSKLRRQVLAALARAEATDHQLALGLALLHQRGTVSKRRGDLVDLGLAEPMLDDDGKPVTRPTDTGCDAQVWRITDEGRRALEEAA